MMDCKVYVATTLSNADRAKEIISLLEDNGITITYNWTEHGRVTGINELRRCAINEENGVRDCDVLLMIFPGGCGTHWEAGFARGIGKPIIMLMEKQVVPTSFHYLPGIIHIKHENEIIPTISKTLNAQ